VLLKVDIASENLDVEIGKLEQKTKKAGDA
jgi:hypothetical protein